MKKFMIATTILLSTAGAISSIHAEPHKNTSTVSKEEVNHGGRTDKTGCHNDNKNGTRHCH